MRHSAALLFVFALALAVAHGAAAQQGRASNAEPLSFGFDQAIIDFERLEWGPLEIEGFPPGAEIVALRGSFDGGPLEVAIRIPAGFRIPNHSHTSSEVYLWIAGDFTYVSAEGHAVDLSGHSFISLPGSSIHALVCGAEPCLFYVRYARSFDIQIHPMPELKKLDLP